MTRGRAAPAPATGVTIVDESASVTAEDGGIPGVQDAIVARLQQYYSLWDTSAGRQAVVNDVINILRRAYARGDIEWRDEWAPMVEFSGPPSYPRLTLPEPVRRQLSGEASPADTWLSQLFADDQEADQ